ncbi:G-protein coupled receptor family C group 5 member B-like isoform X1 [Carassius auratus]|uniref:G-protein coupled receptor family C group 5 member B-like isoform X1 n=2 Tax=Carassius auratus TaxID=7957 RepID=A0A6P6JXZ4_CARAU|nr:G-protein coupled receptor family C group 5 member B-like isoform X1 [Carassius auratus]
MKMSLFRVVFLLLTGLAVSLSEDEKATVPFGCRFGPPRPYTLLCDLDAVWGVVVELVAAAGVFAAILLVMVLLCRLHSVSEAPRRSGIGPILLLLMGIIGLFGLSFAYLVEQNESICVVRRALWGLFFSLCFACMLTQGWRLRKLACESRSPGGCALVGLVLGLTAVQAIIAAEWLFLTVLREGNLACEYQPLDFALACAYVVALLLAALVTATLALCGKARQWHCNVVWLLVSCLLSILLWVAWVGFYVYGNKVLEKSPDWDDPALAVALVAQGWLLLLCHAAPEAHACLRSPPQPSAPDYFDTSQNSSHMRDASLDEDIPLSHRQFVESQGYAFDENAAGLRSGGHHNGNTGARPSAPFRSNVYQPTEMTMILNGGAVPSAPPTYTGRQLW